MKADHVQRVVGVIAPIAGYVGSRLLSQPANGDYRTGAWMFPIGAGVGSVLLLWKKKEEKVSLVLTIFGFVCAAVALFYSSVYLIFDGWMHGM